jgi:hypothetical protein
LPLAVRAFTERAECGDHRRRSISRAWKLPRLLLVFDTETTVDRAQALTFGCARIYRNDAEGLALVEEVLFHADELDRLDPSGFKALTRYASQCALRLLSRREFVNTVLWKVGYQGRAWIVGFNLPFDLSRLAVSWGAARKTGRGGFSLVLWDYWSADGAWRENRYRPRLHVLTIDSKRALISFRRPRDPDAIDLIPDGSETGDPDPAYVFPGHFLDLRSLTFALTNEAHSLASACDAFGVEHGKIAVDQHGLITKDYIGYCRRDVLATSELFERLIAEYKRHPIDLVPTRALSPAAIAKAYLDSMRITPPLEQSPDFPRAHLGQAMSAYVGGRTECRLRRAAVPVVYVDFLSMYPTVNALMRLWAFFVAERIKTVDATEDARRLLAKTELDHCFTAELWQELPVLCLVRPTGEILPARCAYAPGGNWQIGINPLKSREPLWFALADVLAAKLLSGRAPDVLEAVRLVPVGQQRGLKPTRLRGEIEIDPRKDDFFRRAIEERKLLDKRTDLDPRESRRLGETLKVTANSGSYGITAEMTRQELGSRPDDVKVYALGDAFTQRLSAIEEPGRFCFPPLAACITAAARLMLAMLERYITDLGGTYVFSDTDSMAIVATERRGLVRCPGGTGQLRSDDAVMALSFADVDAIAERFGVLSPYNSDAVLGSILKVEIANYDDRGRPRQLYAYAISAKRYCLYTLDENGNAQIVKYSEHGLGHLLNPIDAEQVDRDWIKQHWHLRVRQALGRPVEEPDWLDRPALTKISVTSPQVLRPFLGYNDSRSPCSQIRPYNFLLHAHVAPFGHPLGANPARFRLVAPYERDARRWPKLAWCDLYTGDRCTITTIGDPSPDAVRVKTYRDVLGLYATHPEPKSNGSDGKPCRRDTVGLLQRRPVTMSMLSLIGKESNKLDERASGLVGDLDDVLSDYDGGRYDMWLDLVRPAIADLPTSVLAERSGLDARTIQRVRGGKATPHPRHRAALTLIASELVADRLEEAGMAPPAEPVARLALYLDSRERLASRCKQCGRETLSRRALYCSSACKKRAYRRRISERAA